MGTGFFEGVPVVYPDTLLPKDTIAYKGFLFSECLGAYPPHERTSYMSIVNEEWDEFLRKTLPRDTMSIFVINNDTLRKYGYEMVREKNMIVVRYELSTSNIRELDYTIPYPPSPQMKDMRMSPKYESLLKNQNMINIEKNSRLIQFFIAEGVRKIKFGYLTASFAQNFILVRMTEKAS